MAQTKLEFLDTLPIFAFLTEEELEAVARISKEYEFDAGAVLAYQRDVADKFFIVCSGRLYARGVDEQGIVRESEAYTDGDTFKDVWLFTLRAHPATVRATDPGRVIVIDRDDFVDFLELYPQALEHLAPEYNEEGEHIAGLSAEAWEEAQKSRMAPDKSSFKVGNLPPDELIEYATRRSIWLLALKTIPLILLLVLSLIVYGYASTVISLLALPLLSNTIPLLLVLVFGAAILLQWLDWRNDYFVITTQHIIHYEFNLSLRHFGTVIKRTPIDQVQSVEVERPNFLASILNIGTARVTTAAQSAIIYFDYIDDPHAVHDTLSRLQQRVKELDAGREQTQMRQSLEEHFQAGLPFKAVSDDVEQEVSGEVASPASRPFLSRVRYNFSSRVVDGSVITYRKHVFVLLYATRWPALVGSLLFLFVTASLYFEFRGTFLWSLLAILILADIAWMIWQIEDWRNDTYQVTNRYVIDIDRRPFGTGESRKQAELSNVQNINADRPGFLPTVFNYGNVYIETAGASADITFESVANPNQIQRDIFEKREQFRQQQRMRQGSQRRKEYAVLLDVYKQAVEQDRIPRRTPPSEETEESTGPQESGEISPLN